MMSLTSIRLFLSKHLLFIIAPIIAIILLIIIVSQLLFKPEPKITQEIQTPEDLPKQTVATTITFTAERPNIPNKMAIFLLQTASTSMDSAVSIAQKLGFTEPPQILPAPQNETIYLWRANNLSLPIKSQANRLQYEKSLSPLEKINPPVSLDSAIIALEEFLGGIGQASTNINLSNPNYTLLDNLLEGNQAASVESARFIKLVYRQTVNNLPLISSTPGENSLEAIVASTGEIINLKLDLTINHPLAKEREYSTKSFDEILKELKSGRGIYISSVGDSRRLSSEPVVITLLTITNSELAYLKNPQAPTQILPIVLFEGKALLNNNNEENVQIVISTLQNVQLKPF